MPPLRERLEDIPAIVQYMVGRFSRENNRRPSRFSQSAIELLQSAPWRGNIRELGNVVERLLIMTDRDVIDAADIRPELRPGANRWTPPEPGPASAAVPEPAGVPAPSGAEPATLREFKEWSERKFLVQRLREFGWNISKTADVIDTPRSNLYKKLEQYNIRQDVDG